MHIAYTEPQRAFQAEVRAVIADLMTPALRAELAEREGGGPLYHATLQALGARGWLGLGWPVEHGGGGRPPIEEFIFFDEMHRVGFPIPLLTLNTVGPTLLAYGSEAQKAAYIPKILAGRLHVSIAYSEPQAGTDLASLQTTARRVEGGDHYVISGQKQWISLADHADLLWLAARTGEPGSRHRGISLFLLEMDTPGITLAPIPNLGDSSIYSVFLDDVIAPVSSRVGPENGGWRMIVSQLNHERVALMMVGPLRRLSEEVRDLAARLPDGRGGVLLDRPWARRNLARVEVGLEALLLMNWRQAWNLGRGEIGASEASGIKVYGSEFYVEAYRLLLEITGMAGAVQRGSPGARLRGELERHYRATLVLTFGGGANEVQRDIISTVGLGLPRARR